MAKPEYNGDRFYVGQIGKKFIEKKIMELEKGGFVFQSVTQNKETASFQLLSEDGTLATVNVSVSIEPPQEEEKVS